MRSVSLAALVFQVSTAAADVPVAEVREDAALGLELVAGESVLATAFTTKCTGLAEATAGPVFWVEFDKAGKVVAANVHGAGKPPIDACLEASLRAVKPKRPGPFVLTGRIELREPARPLARESKTAVLIAPHAARWQLTVQQLAYTANRAADLAASLDGVSDAIAACAPKRGAKAEAAQAIAWLAGGKAVFRSGNPVYDRCVAAALAQIKLPEPESALWMKLAIMAPAEPLAPRTDKAGLSRDQALRDALTTAVRSRKEILRTCLDGKANATIDQVKLALAGTKATVVKVTGTLDAEIDACVRKKFGEVAIPSAKPEDKLELEIKLDPI
ncbi:MAG: hypothetical protein ABI867_14655 [Kofleriaceae bacterium]